MSPRARLSTKPRKRLSREERRAHFIDMAAELITEEGIDALTMEGIAERAGVSKALGYRYFENRDDVLLALFERESEDFGARLDAALADATTFEERLRAILETFLDSIKDKGELVATLQLSSLGTGPAEDERLRAQRSSNEAIAAMMIDEYGISHKSAMTAAAVYISGVIGLISLWTQRVASRRELVDDYITIALGGLERLAESATKKPARKTAAKAKPKAKR